MLKYILAVSLSFIFNFSLLAGGSSGGVGIYQQQDVMETIAITLRSACTSESLVVQIDSLVMNTIEETQYLEEFIMLYKLVDHDTGLRDATIKN